MKPFSKRFGIVTATLRPERALDCWASWIGRALHRYPVFVVWSSLPGQEPVTVPASAWKVFPDLTIIAREGGGVIPAFAAGVACAANTHLSALLCLHADVLIEEDGWDGWILEALDQRVRYAGLAGGTGLGAPHIYQAPYDPMQLARRDFVSNLREAEQHGRRATAPQPCVVFDELSLFGTTDWFAPAWAEMAASGIRHHAYGAYLAILAHKAGVQPGRMLPIRAHHFGGREAVALPEYQHWAREQDPAGDAGFWESAHRIVFEAGRGILPLRTW